MLRYDRASRLRCGFVLGLLALLWMSQEASHSQPAPGGTAQPKPLTPEQQARLKESDRLWFEGHKLQAAGKLAEALAAAEKHLAIDRELVGGKHARVAEGLQWLAEVHEQREDFTAARTARQEVVAVLTKLHGGGDWRVTDARLALADTERLAGLTREQRAQLAQASRLNVQAVALWQQGKYAQAIPSTKKALAIRQTVLGQDHPSVAQSLNNLATLYQALGRSAEAEPLFQRSLKIREAKLGPYHPDVATSLNNLAELYRALGRSADAEPVYRRNLKIREASLGPDHPDVAASLDNLAQLYRALGRYAEAEPLYKRSLKIFEAKLGPDHPDVALSLNNLAGLYRALGRYAEAEPLYKRSLKIFEAKLGKDDPAVATNLNNLAALYLALGRYAEAEPLFRRAIQVVEDHLRRTGAGLSERQLLLLAGKSRFFLDNYLSLAAAARLPADGPYAAALAWKGRAFAQQRQVQLARRLHYHSNPATARLYEQLERASQQLAQLALASPEKALAPADLGRRERDLVRLSDEVDALQQKLAGRSAAFRRLQQEARLTTAQLQKLLPQDAVLIDFLVYQHHSPPKAKKGRETWEQRLAAFVVQPGRPVELVDLGPMKPITEAVDGWRKHFGLGAAGKDDPAAATLRRLLWQPLAEKVAGAKLVLVSPDGALGKFPFAALPGSKPGTFLLEEVALAVLPVPQLLPQLLAPPEGAAKREPSLLLVGEVDYEAAPGAAAAPGPSQPAAKRADVLGQMKALPGTRAEALAIQDSFQRGFPQAKLTLLREQKPTEGAVRIEAPKHRYLHFATHGFFAPAKLRSALAESSRPDGPGGPSPFGRQGVSGFHPGLLSGIVLAGANQEPGPGEDDGILTALEVAALDLGGVDLAVLSACETGLGETAGGEGLLGLQRAFQVAGARSVVASLWQVRDDATRALMVDFYENLWRKKLPKHEALRQAQLTMLREGVQRGLGEPEAQARRLPPYYWAAFVLSGDWRGETPPQHKVTDAEKVPKGTVAPGPTAAVAAGRKLIADNAEPICRFAHAAKTYAYRGSEYLGYKTTSEGLHELTFQFTVKGNLKTQTMTMAFAFEDGGKFRGLRVLAYTTTYEPFKRLSVSYLKQLRKQVAQRPGIQNNAALRRVVDNADARRLCEMHLEHAQAAPGKP